MPLPLVSVIVPTYHSSKFLGECLKSIKNQTYKNIELIVIDNNSIDNTTEIAKKYTNKVFSKGPERSAQRNYGAQKSTGEFLLIIDSDMLLSKDVVRDCVELILGNPTIKAIIISEESFGEGFWSQCKKLERSFYVGIEWLEAARYFRRSVFFEMGGHDEMNTGTEDYDLPQRIEHRYGRNVIGRIGSLIHHNEGRTSLINLCKKKFYYAQSLKRYESVPENREKYKKQSNIIARYKLFFSRPKLLFRNPLLGVGMLAMKACEFVAGGVGYILSLKRSSNP